MAEPAVDRLREPILGILRKSDLSSISAKKVRLALADVPDSTLPGRKLVNTLGIRLDDKQHKKLVDELIRDCFDVINDSAPAAPAGSSENGHSTSKDVAAAAASNGHPYTATAAAAQNFQPRIALPGLGGIPGSHATSSSSTAAATSAPPKSSASSAAAAAGGKRSRKADDVISDDEEDAEAVKRKANGKGTTSGSKKTSSKGTATKKRKSTGATDATNGEKPPPNPNNPFNRPVILSDEMSQICGGKEMPRYMITKQLWAYIKERELQNPSNKRQILCDPALTQLFGKSTVDSFEMAKLITKHVTKKTD